jgi:8-oxo-dGTP diphosphatase
MIDVVAAVIEQRSRVLIARRAPHKHLAGFWEFPGGKVEPGETPEAALARELAEEFGVEATIGGLVGVSVHDDGTMIVRLTAYRARVAVDIRASTDHDRLEWVRRERLSGYRLAPADVPLLSRL